MDVKKIKVSQLARQLSECNQEAEGKIIIGAIPQSIPIDTLAIKQNIEGEELVTLVIDHQTFVEILDYGISLIERDENGA